MIIRLLTVAAALSLGTGANAATIVNASFETGTNPGGFTSIAPGSSAITGWTVGPAGVDYIGTYWTASQGVRSVDLSAGASGTIGQSITGLRVGATYAVTFDMSGNPDGADEVKSLNLSIAGGPTSLFTYTVTAANTRSNMLWSQRTFSFVASGTSQFLMFAGVNPSPFGAAIDSVAIAQTRGVVPEPATWAMLIAGFGMVGVALRRRGGVAIA